MMVNFKSIFENHYVKDILARFTARTTIIILIMVALGHVALWCGKMRPEDYPTFVMWILSAAVGHSLANGRGSNGNGNGQDKPDDPDAKF